MTGEGEVTCFTGTTSWDGHALTWMHDLDLAPSRAPRTSGPWPGTEPTCWSPAAASRMAAPCLTPSAGAACPAAGRCGRCARRPGGSSRGQAEVRADRGGRTRVDGRSSRRPRGSSRATAGRSTAPGRRVPSRRSRPIRSTTSRPTGRSTNPCGDAPPGRGAGCPGCPESSLAERGTRPSAADGRVAGRDQVVSRSRATARVGEPSRAEPTWRSTEESLGRPAPCRMPVTRSTLTRTAATVTAGNTTVNGGEPV